MPKKLYTYGWSVHDGHHFDHVIDQQSIEQSLVSHHERIQVDVSLEWCLERSELSQHSDQLFVHGFDARWQQASQLELGALLLGERRGLVV